MRNMKVSKKLIFSFVLVILLTVTVGVIGIFGMTQIEAAMEDMYNLQTVPMPDIGKVNEYLQRQRACMRELIIGAATNDLALIEDAHDRAEEYDAKTQLHIDLYRETIKDPYALQLFDEAMILYETEFHYCMETIYEGAVQGRDANELYDIMREYTPVVNKIVENFDICLDMKIEVAGNANDEATASANMMLVLIIAALVLAVVISMFFALYISNIISKPLKVVSDFMNRAGSTGNINHKDEEKEEFGYYAGFKDEIGVTIANINHFMAHIQYIAKELETLAGGDLTANINVVSDEDVMGIAVKHLADSLDKIFTELNVASAQVAVGAQQISDGAQSLAQGSSEQAASVQQLSSSIAEIANQTRGNADMANQTASLADTIKDKAEKGSRQMSDMMSAVKEIDEASQAISRVIKTIDDIAFQTNILALNAAVEAARAGQHGKGFAVVAEEVRSLASKSAEAAHDTGDMIANSIAKSELGARIAKETEQSLNEIVSGINESTKHISEIARSLGGQAASIDQINIGVEQVTQVVQSNSATSEQSAAASEELNAQANMLEELVAEFKLRDNKEHVRSKPQQLDGAGNRPLLHD